MGFFGRDEANWPGMRSIGYARVAVPPNDARPGFGTASVPDTRDERNTKAASPKHRKPSTGLECLAQMSGPRCAAMPDGEGPTALVPKSN